MKRCKLGSFFIIISLQLYLFQPNLVFAKDHEVSVRSVFQSMGYKVTKEGKNIKLTREQDDIIKLLPSSKNALKNGRRYTLSKPIRYDKRKKQYYISVLDVYGLAKEEKKEKHYRVQKDDTLWSIAKRFHATTSDLKEWNNLTSNVIVPGQHLHTVNPVYIVQSGDSIWEIAHKTESTILDIKTINNLSFDVVFPGQKLLLPTQPSIIPPREFSDGVFPLAQETYEPYGDSYGQGRSFSTDGKNRSHEGIDIMTAKWVPVFSAMNGTIVKYGWNTLGGYRITIKAKNGVTFYYAHLMDYPPGLKKGQRVSKGQLIGFAGDTGYGKKGTHGKFAPHLHFGMYSPNGKAINPHPYLIWWEMKP